MKIIIKHELRPYQQQAINAVFAEPYGSKVIIALSVGLGKTFTSVQIIEQLEQRLQRPVKALWIARQRQLVYQPATYFTNRTVGMEMGTETSNGEDVIIATAQSLHRRLDKFPKDYFDVAIFDECFTGDVEILTENGFVRFDGLENEKVAQLHGDFKLDYVKPKRKISYHYKGEMVGSRLDVASRIGGEWIYMTPNHQQVYYDLKTQKLESTAIKDFKDDWENNKRIVDRLTSANDSERRLTPIERVYIMAQADGCIVGERKNGDYRYRFVFSKERKKERFLENCKNAGIEVKVGATRKFNNPKWKDSQSYYITLNKDCKKFINVFDYDFTYTLANEFIQEMSYWDGYRRHDDYIDYDSKVEENSNYVSYVGFIGGWKVVQKALYKNKNRAINHRVTLTRPKGKPFKVSNKFNISRIDYNGMVYCVEVPEHRIIVRKNGYIFVSGNCQEIAGKQYSDILHYFDTKYSVGLTGTPFRLDGKKLTDNLFDKIVFQRNIKWGIEQDFLCDVEAVRVQVGYDLSSVRTSGGDYNIQDLEQAMVGTEHAVAEAYYKYGVNKPTLIFATGVAHAYAIASLIEGARVIVGTTKQEERDEIFTGFQNKEIPCIVSVQVMTQGVDLPISTVGIFAKPTKSVGRYQQQVGRILRNHPDKEKALIVDCVGSSNLGLCTAPSLIGINVDKVPEGKQKDIEGDLMDMIDLVEQLSDTPTSWIKNTKHVELWAKENKYKTKNVNYFQMPDGRMVVSLPERAKIVLPAPDMLGKVDATEIKGLAHDFHQWGINEYGETWDYQRALNAVRAMLERAYGESSMIWDLKKTKRWGNKPATEAQMKVINRKVKEELPELNRFEASQIINRVKMK